MCQKISLDSFITNFEELNASAPFENICDGRQGAVLVNIENGSVPLIRTTTCYENPPQQMKPIHLAIMDEIKKHIVSTNTIFNNALIEIYDNRYKNMGWHSDQALDLEYPSIICLFSMYSNPSTKNKRQLKIKSKKNTQLNCDPHIIDLDHNSIVFFSTTTNEQNLHKIVLDHKDHGEDTKWIGITFRCSKTFVTFDKKIPYLYPNIPLRLANDEEKKEFYKKAKNNDRTKVPFTISPSDFMYPII